MEEWSKKHPVGKTWALWKYTFLEDYMGLQRQTQACGGYDQFGSENTASVEDTPYRPPISGRPDIIHKMNDYMDNKTNCVTNEKALIEQLVATNGKQASTIATSFTTVLTLSD